MNFISACERLSSEGLLFDLKEVKYRKVLEDDGIRQLVELEQLASWRFLWLSGTLSACVLVDQDRSTHMVQSHNILRSRRVFHVFRF